MDKKYWIRIGGENQGPFSFDELLSVQISDETYYWTENIEHWKQLKDFPMFREKKILLEKKSRRKKNYKYYLCITILGIVMLLFSQAMLRSESKQLTIDYGDDWLIQSALQNFNFWAIINIFSKYFIALGLLLFISTKRIGIIIITILITFIFFVLLYSSSKSINSYLSNLGEKDLPGINEMNKNLGNDLHNKLNSPDNNNSAIEKSNNYPESISKKYVIVYLKTIDNTGSGYDEDGIYQTFLPVEKDNVTGVSEYEYFDETEKAKLEDMVVSKYINSIDAKVNKGRIISKKTYIFDTYIEASKKRNEFLME